MNSHGLRQCTCERGAVFIRVIFPIRVLGVLVLLLAISSSGGCIATRLKAASSRAVEMKMDVFVHSEIGAHVMDNICIFPFSSPPEMAEASCSLTSAFQARLLQRHPFRETMVLRHEVKSDAEALWYARSEGCALAMIPALLYMMDGTGAMPTELDIRTRILDARTGKVLWDVKQCARSQPGADIDLTWNTVIGQPAQRCQVMADGLAQQFAESLVPPPEE
jgi:hypothetical protein